MTDVVEPLEDFNRCNRGCDCSNRAVGGVTVYDYGFRGA